MPKINTYTDNATIEDVDAVLTYDPSGSGATKLTTFARIASWVSAKLAALGKKTTISSADQILMVNGSAAARIDYNVLAKAIIEQYAGSTVAGSAQSVKAALDALNSNKVGKGGLLTSSLDAMFTPGIYWVRKAQASGVQPVYDFYMLVVESTGYSDTATQIAYNMDNAVSSSRIYANGNWSAWERTPTRAEVDELNSKLIDHFMAFEDVPVESGVCSVSINGLVATSKAIVCPIRKSTTAYDRIYTPQCSPGKLYLYVRNGQNTMPADGTLVSFVVFWQ